MDRLTEHLEELIEELEDDGLDVEYSVSLLSLLLPPPRARREQLIPNTRHPPAERLEYSR